MQFDGNQETAFIFSQLGGNPFPYELAGYNRTGSSGADGLYGSDYAQQMRPHGSGYFYDRVYGRDTLSGGDGADYIDGRGENDYLTGGNGNDIVVGGAGNDFLHGNLNNDHLEGRDGNDTVQGGMDNDTLSGGNGNDYVSGDASNNGYNHVFGGAGADIFHNGGNGHDLVGDFSYAEGDRVMIEGTTYSASQQGADILVTLGTGFTVIVGGTTLSSLPSDWIFAV